MSEKTERMTVETVEICTCGTVMTLTDLDTYDTLGADNCTCCPDCGNEKFQTIAELQAELEQHRWIPVTKELPENEIRVFVVCGTEDNLHFDTDCYVPKHGGYWQTLRTDIKVTHWKPISPPKCEHEWGTDGQHSNEYCKKCFIAKPEGE